MKFTKASELTTKVNAKIKESVKSSKDITSDIVIESRDLDMNRRLELLQIDEKLLGITNMTSDDNKKILSDVLNRKIAERTSRLTELVDEAKIKDAEILSSVAKSSGINLHKLGLSFYDGERKVFGINELAKQPLSDYSTEIIIRDTLNPLNASLNPTYAKDDVVIVDVAYTPLSYGRNSSSMYNVTNKASELDSFSMVMDLILSQLTSKKINVGDPTIMKDKSEFTKLVDIAKRLGLRKDQFKKAFQDIISKYSLDKLVDAVYEKLDELAKEAEAETTK